MNILRIGGITEYRKETCEDCINKVYQDSENNWEINTDDIAIECPHQTGVKSGSKSRTIAVQFNSFNNKIETL